MRGSSLLLLSPLWLGACGGAADEGRGRGVLIVAIDALRFDHTSFSDYDRDTTPQLASWFEENGVVFTDTWSPGPQLLPAHLALLTGCDPTVSRVPPVVLSDGSTQPPLVEWFVPNAVPTLAEEFLGAGWRTAAFVDLDYLEKRRGIERGFREFEDVGRGRSGDKRLLKGVGQRFIEWVDDLDQGEDWFAYVHCNDLDARWSGRWEAYGEELPLAYGPRPELDRVPPVALRSPTFFALPASRLLDGAPTLGTYEAHYDTALSWIDGVLYGLIGALKQRGQLGRTTIVVTGTYGLGFGESGLVVDSGTLAPCDLHVPLLIRPARVLQVEPARVDRLVGLADVAPTLLSLHGIPVPGGMHGANLVPLINGRVEAVHEQLFASHAITEGFAVVTEDHHYSWWDPRDRGSGSSLSMSWYGWPRGQTEGVRILVPRDAAAAAWLDGELPAADPGPVATRLHALGVARYDDLYRARGALHPMSEW